MMFSYVDEKEHKHFDRGCRGYFEYLLVDGGLDHGEVGVVLRGAAVGDDT